MKDGFILPYLTLKQAQPFRSNNLVSKGLIESKNRGLPAKRCFRIIENIELITSLIAAGEEKEMSIKPAAALSYEKKRKSANSCSQPFPSCSEETTEQGTDPPQPNSEDFGACSEETAEQADEFFSPLLQRNCGASSEKSAVPYFNKSKDNKSKGNNHLSFNHTDECTDLIDMIDEKQPTSPVVPASQRADYLDLIKDNIDYDCLVEQNRNQKDRINEIVSLMLDVICSSKQYIRVNGEDFPQEVVKSQFLKLDSGHIEYVIMAMDKCPSNIRNIRSYLITALYNAPHTIGSFFSALVNHDMHGND